MAEALCGDAGDRRSSGRSKPLNVRVFGEEAKGEWSNGQWVNRRKGEKEIGEKENRATS
jgi:hypothetical protein